MQTDTLLCSWSPKKKPVSLILYFLIWNSTLGFEIEFNQTEFICIPPSEFQIDFDLNT